MQTAIEAFIKATQGNAKGAVMISSALKQEESTMMLSFASGFEADKMTVLRDLLILSTQIAQSLEAPETEEILVGLKRACFAHPLVSAQNVVNEFVNDGIGSSVGH